METYKEFINNILEIRGRFNCGEEYHERHHIKPKCIGGTNDEENLIDLYGREHFIAHKLLAEENPDNAKIVSAWWNMCQIQGRSKQRYVPTPEEYESARKAFVKHMSEMMTGENNPAKREKIKQILSDNHANVLGANNPRARKVIRLCDNTIYDYAAQAAEENNIAYKQFTRLCRLCKKFMYYDEYLQLQLSNPVLLDEYIADSKLTFKEIEQKRRSKAQRNIWSNQEYRDKYSLGGHPTAKRVIRLSDGVIYDCAMQGAVENNMTYDAFTYRCRKCQDFMYYDEWLTQQND